MTVCDCIIADRGEQVTASAVLGDASIGECHIVIQKNNWRITKWFVNDLFLKDGIDINILKNLCAYCIRKYGTPNEVIYDLGNGSAYTEAWLRDNFNLEYIGTAKVPTKDGNQSGTYRLDTEKFLTTIVDGG